MHYVIAYLASSMRNMFIKMHLFQIIFKKPTLVS